MWRLANADLRVVTACPPLLRYSIAPLPHLQSPVYPRVVVIHAWATDIICRNCQAPSQIPNPQGPAPTQSNPVKISSKGTGADTKILHLLTLTLITVTVTVPVRILLLV